MRELFGTLLMIGVVVTVIFMPLIVEGCNQRQTENEKAIQRKTFSSIHGVVERVEYEHGKAAVIFADGRVKYFNNQPATAIELGSSCLITYNGLDEIVNVVCSVPEKKMEKVP